MSESSTAPARAGYLVGYWKPDGTFHASGETLYEYVRDAEDRAADLNLRFSASVVVEPVYLRTAPLRTASRVRAEDIRELDRMLSYRGAGRVSLDPSERGALERILTVIRTEPQA
jgi:hypothetical protein